MVRAALWDALLRGLEINVNSVAGDTGKSRPPSSHLRRAARMDCGIQALERERCSTDSAHLSFGAMGLLATLPKTAFI
jgi:hypothetical protein